MSVMSHLDEDSTNEWTIWRFLTTKARSELKLKVIVEF